MSKVIAAPRVRSAMNFDKKAWSNKWGFKCTDVSRTVQAHKDEADINNIVKAFGITGKLPQGLRVPTYGDFEGVDDYRSAVELVKEAEANFLKVPAELRAKLGHDPGNFAEWCADPGNLEEMRKLGLAVPKTEVSQGKETGSRA